jgi:hypothetical protein
MFFGIFAHISIYQNAKSPPMLLTSRGLFS